MRWSKDYKHAWCRSLYMMPYVFAYPRQPSQSWPWTKQILIQCLWCAGNALVLLTLVLLRFTNPGRFMAYASSHATATAVMAVSTESHALPTATAFFSKYNLCYQRYYIWFVWTLQTMLLLFYFYLSNPTCFRQKEEETEHQAKGKAQPMLRMSVNVKLPMLPAEGNQRGGWSVIRGNWVKMSLLI